MSLSSLLFILLMSMIWYDSPVWLYSIAEYTTAIYFFMIVQYDRAEDLLICCIAEYTTITDYLYVWHSKQ